jgi:hypothetical protein
MNYEIFEMYIYAYLYVQDKAVPQHTYGSAGVEEE